MKAKNKARALVATISTAVLSFVSAVFVLPTNVASAEGYYYADEPVEVALATQNVFTYIAGQGNIALATSGEMEAEYRGSFGGTVGKAKTESHDWNLNENYAFMLDFSDTWTGSFFVELGHYDVAIHKETNQIVTGVGGGYQATTTDAPGLSDLTGMQKVNVINKVVYSDSAKTNPVGVQLNVTIGDSFAWSFDQIYTGHLTCSLAHGYYFVNKTGVALEYDLDIPVTYYYAEEPVEVSLATQNVFAWVPGQGNVALGNSGEMEPGYRGDFGGTVGKAKTESHDWNVNESYAFTLDFSDTWTGAFFIELGHYDLAIHKETNKIVVGVGGGYQTVETEAPGLSDLTGMQKVIVSNRVVYGDEAKTTPVGVQSSVKIGDGFTWSYDRISTQHISCTNAHGYYFENNTGVALEYNLKIPVNYYCAEDPIETPLKDFAPLFYTWADGVGGKYYDFSYLQEIQSQTYYLRDANNTDLTNPTTWEGRDVNVAFQLDFSNSWGTGTIWNKEESGFFCLALGYADVSIHKDTNEIVIGAGGKYSIIETGKLEGLSDLTGLQKVNIIQKVLYADEAKTTPVAMRYTVKIGELSYVYDWDGFPYNQSSIMRLIVVMGSPVLFSGLSDVPKSEYTMTFITDDNVQAIAPVQVNAGGKLQKPSLNYLNKDAVLLGYYINGTDTLFNFDAFVSADTEIEVRFADEVKKQEIEDFTTVTYKEAWNATDYLKDGDSLPENKAYNLCNGNGEVYATEPSAPYNPSFSVGGIAFKADLGTEGFEVNEAFGWTRTSVYFRVVPAKSEVQIYIADWKVEEAAENGTLAPVATIDIGDESMTGVHSFAFKAEWLYYNDEIVGRLLTVTVDGVTYDSISILDTQTANWRTVLTNHTNRAIPFYTMQPELYLEKLQNAYVESAYTASTWTIVEKYINDTYLSLKQASSNEERTAIYNGAIVTLNAYPNKEAEAVIAVKREKAYADFAGNYKEADYEAEAWASVQTILGEAQAEYNQCLKESEIETVTNKYLIALGAIATKQLTALKTAIVTEIENAVAGKTYSAENLALVNEIIEAYKAQIQAENNTAYLQALKESALKELGEVVALSTSEPIDSTEEKGGCSSYAGSWLAIPMVAFIAIIMIKRKKEN